MKTNTTTTKTVSINLAEIANHITTAPIVNPDTNRFTRPADWAKLCKTEMPALVKLSQDICKGFNNNAAISNRAILTVLNDALAHMGLKVTLLSCDARIYAARVVCPDGKGRVKIAGNVSILNALLLVAMMRAQGKHYDIIDKTRKPAPAKKASKPAAKKTHKTRKPAAKKAA